MFFIKKIIIIICIVTVILAFNNNNVTSSNIIPSEAIRFRIIAGSNKIADQALKMDIKTDIQKDLFPLLEDAKNINTARNIILNNLNTIDTNLLPYNIEYNISYGNNYFPEKNYMGTAYQAGQYESLVITLGEGKGENWWCVLFPPLCLLEAEESTSEKIEYKSFFKEMINKINK